jgi:hypothetical protein
MEAIMKVKIEGYVIGWHWGQPDRKIIQFDFRSGKLMDDEFYVHLGPYTVELELELPSQGELTQRLVEVLRKEKAAAYVHAAQKAAELDERIEKLLCLTNEVAA